MQGMNWIMSFAITSSVGSGIGTQETSAKHIAVMKLERQHQARRIICQTLLMKLVKILMKHRCGKERDQEREGIDVREWQKAREFGENRQKPAIISSNGLQCVVTLHLNFSAWQKNIWKLSHRINTEIDHLFRNEYQCNWSAFLPSQSDK